MVWVVWCVGSCDVGVLEEVCWCFVVVWIGSDCVVYLVDLFVWWCVFVEGFE